MKSKIVALSKSAEFKKILSMKKVSNKYVTIFFGNLPKKDNKKLNISFITRKKIANAVKRNKIKRRLRSIFDAAVEKLLVNLNHSYLVIAKPSMLNSNFIDIKEKIIQDFEKIK